MATAYHLPGLEDSQEDLGAGLACPSHERPGRAEAKVAQVAVQGTAVMPGGRESSWPQGWTSFNRKVAAFLGLPRLGI